MIAQEVRQSLSRKSEKPLIPLTQSPICVTRLKTWDVIYTDFRPSNVLFFHVNTLLFKIILYRNDAAIDSEECNNQRRLGKVRNTTTNSKISGKARFIRILYIL